MNIVDIFYKIFKKKINRDIDPYGEEDWDEEKSEVLKDLRGIKNPNTVKIYAGDDVYSITDCIKEVEDDTDFGYNKY